MSDEIKQTYKINCDCDNCGYTGEVSFAKGFPVPSKFVCPNCGCETAKPCKSTVYRGALESLRPLHSEIITVPPTMPGDPCNPHEVKVWCKSEMSGDVIAVPMQVLDPTEPIKHRSDKQG